jgi:histidyl-tRNA synthetase
MSKSYQSIRGTHDFNPEETLIFNNVTSRAREVLKTFGYEEIILPLLEEEGVFVRGLGEATDIVEKQIFKIADKEMVLRPEGTAQVIRYYVENSLHNQNDFLKFCYFGPMFRGERPQKGRFRQFHHIGCEVIGSDNVYLDAEIIQTALKILDSVGVKEKEIKINTLGCAEDKANFSRQLREKLSNRKHQLCEDCQRRLDKNPLRVIDCKEDKCKAEVASLNLAQSCLCEPCASRFKELLSLLDLLGIAYKYSPFLVRGLDYYTHTVFEITSPSLGSQDAIGAGGRYNNLVNELGGPQVPAIGFALGMERVLLALADAQKPKQNLDVFMVVIGADELRKTAMKITNDLRCAGIVVDMDYCDRSVKGQFRYAEKKGARFAAILGEDEAREDCVMLKEMKTGQQEKVKIGDLVLKLKN